MTIVTQHQAFIDDFFNAIEPLHKANKNPSSLSYLVVKHGEEFYLVQGALVFNTAPSKTPFSHFRSDNIRADNYRLSELNLDARGVVTALLSGELPTPDGKLLFPGNESGNRGVTYEPFHQEGIKAQSRFDVLTLLGGSQATYIRQPLFDWELRAAPAPYDGLQELAFEYKIGQLRGVVSGEVIAFNVAAVDFTSVVSGSNARLAVFLVHGLSTENVTLGYRLFTQGRVESRSIIKGGAMQWTQTTDHQYGTADIDVPNAAVIQCFVSYCGIAQHFAWVSDPTTMQNPKRAVYNIFDANLEILNDFLSKSGGKGRNARHLESGIAWLLWMLGFSVAHLGGTERTQEAADLIATTPKGDFVVIECTTGLLKTDNKLPLLIERAERIRAGVVASNNKHLRVLAAIVTSRTRAEISADIEQAEKLGVLVMSRENLEQAVPRTLVLPNAEQLYEEAIKTVESAKAKYDAQTASIAQANARALDAQFALENFKPPRTLSPEQRQHVADKMSPYKGHRVVVGAVPLTNESSGLASKIFEALKLKPAEIDAFMNQIGVAAGPNGKLTQEPIAKGAQVKFTTGNDKAQKFADALAAALNDESITAFAAGGLREDTMAWRISQGLDRNSEINEPVTIVVGEKP